MDTTSRLDALPVTSTHPTVLPARWAWWGVAAGALGLAGNLVASRGPMTDADAATALGELDRSTQHAGTLLGMACFVALLLLAGGWRRWSADRGLVEQALAPAVTATATLVLLGVGLRGALSEYLPGGINDDNFADEGLFVLFMLHDTAPWFAWWGVVALAGMLAHLSFTARVVPRWLGVLSVVAVLLPVGVMAGSGAVAGAGFVAPLWLAVASLVVGLRGLPRA